MSADIKLLWKYIEPSLIGMLIAGLFSIVDMIFIGQSMGKIGLVAYTMVTVVESLGSILMIGLAAGMQPLVAQMYGAGKFKRQNRIGVYSYWMHSVSGRF